MKKNFIYFIDGVLIASAALFLCVTVSAVLYILNDSMNWIRFDQNTINILGRLGLAVACVTFLNSVMLFFTKASLVLDEEKRDSLGKSSKSDT